ncbi:hypothetical protein E2C01_001758 [Portunus trituberculatus]|uniref:Uncharacterized protein n=1 Tax=Portunus trituberculatus TaxID=210409 RepID=A0A5B7CIR7_PORTR|nr:hypothetical protein [Portunus trituberculatus]
MFQHSAETPWLPNQEQTLMHNYDTFMNMWWFGYMQRKDENDWILRLVECVVEVAVLKVLNVELCVGHGNMELDYRNVGLLVSWAG